MTGSDRFQDKKPLKSMKLIHEKKGEIPLPIGPMVVGVAFGYSLLLIIELL